MTTTSKVNVLKTTDTPSIASAEAAPNISLVGGIRLSKWRRQVGLSRTTVWRWRKSGRLPVVMRYNVAFLSAETVKRFFSDDSIERGHKTQKEAKGDAVSVQPPRISSSGNNVG